METRTGSHPTPAGTSPPARAPRAHRALLDAARELLRERDVADLSVTLICARAEVSRPSFYEHFGDIGTLVHAAAIEDLREALGAVPTPRAEYWADDIAPVLEQMIAGLASRRVVFRRVLAGPSSYPFVRGIIAVVVERLVTHAPLDARAPGTAQFLAAGATALVIAALDRPEFTDAEIAPLAEQVAGQLRAALGLTG